MRPLRAALLAVMLLATGVPSVFAGDSWLSAGHDAQWTDANVASSAVTPATAGRLAVAWRGPLLVAAAATDRYVYGITPGSGLVILDARNGRALRTMGVHALRLGGRGAGAIVYVAGRAVLASTAAIAAVDPRSGRVLWRDGIGASWLVADRGIVFTGKACDMACGGAMASVALDARTGRVLWRHPGNFGNAPAVLGGRIYQSWGQGAGQTSVYDALTGASLGRLGLYANWTGSGARVYADVSGAATARSWVGQVGPSGAVAWKTDVGHVGATEARPAYAYGTLFVASNRFSPGIVALDSATGKLRWAQNVGGGIRTIAGGHLLIVLHVASGRLDLLRVDNGQAVRSIALRGYTPGRGEQALLMSGDTLYVLGGSGLIALRA